MAKPAHDLVTSFLGGDILSAYRKRIWNLFGAVCIFVFLPGSVYVYVDGYKLLSAAVLVMLGSFVLNGIALVRDKAARVTMAIFVASLTFVIGLCIVQRGVVGAFWIYPGVLMINFLTFGWLARIYTAIFFVAMAGALLYTLEPQVAVRSLVGLAVTVAITNIFLGMIDQLQKKLVEQSSIDPLTGALNRREMDAILRDATERKRRSNTPASVLVFDVDQFKSVNDTYGHAVGDHVLKELVTLVVERSRYLDQLFRLGGEEFILLLPDTDASGALTLAEDIRLRVEETQFIDDRKITISIGLSELETDEVIDHWIKRGDDALFAAKRNGRNQIVMAESLEVPEAVAIAPYHTDVPPQLIAV